MNMYYKSDEVPKIGDVVKLRSYFNALRNHPGLNNKIGIIIAIRPRRGSDNIVLKLCNGDNIWWSPSRFRLVHRAKLYSLVLLSL